MSKIELIKGHIDRLRSTDDPEMEDRIKEYESTLFYLTG